LSSDHDPLYRFHQWQANCAFSVKEIKTEPDVPLSHPFVERLIGSFVEDNKTSVLLRSPLCGVRLHNQQLELLSPARPPHN